MSDLDVSKMKVAELRAELQQRGLDTKGVKAVLQARLRDALDEEFADSPAQESVEGDGEKVDEIAQEASELLEPQEENTDPEADQEEEADNQTAEEVMEEDSKPEPQEAEEDISDAKEDVPAEQELMEVKEEVKEEGTDVDGQVAKVKDEVTEVKDEAAEVKDEAAEVKDEVTEVKDEVMVVKDEVMEVKDEVEDDVTEVKEEVKEDEKTDRKDVKQEGEDRDRERRDDRSRNHKGRRDRSPRRRSPPPVVMEEDDGIPETQCVLSKYISDLNLKISKDGYSATPLSMDGFAFLWSGVRATHGITKGKVCFQVKLVEHMDVKHLPEDEKTPHVVRVGWSLDKTSLQLGEEPLSYGFGGTAKFSTNCKFENYGEKFTKGDVITAYLDLEGEKPVISYAKNDKDLGVAHTIQDDLEGAPLFPHILVKNTAIEVNLGQKEEPYFPVTEGFTFIASLPEEDSVRGPIPPPEKKDCEIIMMVGLPGAGKTTWAEKYVKEHPEKKYYILGTNLIMDKMKVMGLRRQRNYAGRFDSLIDKSTKCLNRFFEMAPRKKRNYVLDQTNVYPSARRRKMRPFEGFSSKAIVIVPTDEEFKKRIEKRTKEEGKDVPDHAVLEMKANFELPVKGELFDEVDFVELPLDEAKPLVEKYRKEGVDKLGPNYRRNRDRNRGGNRDNRSRYDNRSPRGGNRSGGYQSGGYRGGNRNYGSGNHGGGGGNYGYRDNRNRAGGQGGYGNRSYGSGSYGSGGGGGYGGSGGGGYGGSSGNYRQNYGGNYGSQGGGYNQNRNSGYGQSGGGGYNSGYNSGYGSNQPSGGYGGGYSSGYNYNQYNQASAQSYGQQQYPQQQQYQQYYQQQSNQSSYNPYANYYSNYNQSSGYNQGR